jgi:hypothetical protein
MAKTTEGKKQQYAEQKDRPSPAKPSNMPQVTELENTDSDEDKVSGNEDEESEKNKDEVLEEVELTEDEDNKLSDEEESEPDDQSENQNELRAFNEPIW